MSEPLTKRFNASLSGPGIDLLIKLSFPILMGVAGWAGTTITDHENRIYVIEASRYTPENAKEDMRDAASERERLKVQISSLQADSAVSQATAAETVKRMDRIERKLDKVLDKLGER